MQRYLGDVMAFVESRSDVGGTAADPASSDRFDIRTEDDQNKTLGIKESFRHYADAEYL